MQWCFSRLHPNLALYLGHAWSKHSRLTKGFYADFKGNNEWLIQHSEEILKSEHFNFFIYGHRHIPVHINLSEKSEYICLGDWIVHYTYAKFDGEKMLVESTEPEQMKRIVR